MLLFYVSPLKTKKYIKKNNTKQDQKVEKLNFKTSTQKNIIILNTSSIFHFTSSTSSVNAEVAFAITIALGFSESVKKFLKLKYLVIQRVMNFWDRDETVGVVVIRK